LYTGQELDPESDLYNYNARLYNPKTGAFISADTVGGGNRYAYAKNNPMMFVDPSGHDNWWADTGGGGSGGGSGGVGDTMSLVDLYIQSGFQWTNGIYAPPPSFPLKWYEANLPYWNGEFGTIPGTSQTYTPSLGEQFILGKLRPELQDQITNQVVGSVAVDTYQSAVVLGGMAMAGGLSSLVQNKMMESPEQETNSQIRMYSWKGVRNKNYEPIELAQPNPSEDYLIPVNESKGLYKFTDPVTGTATEIHLGQLEAEAVETARVAGTTCSTHLADLGYIDMADTGLYHDAFRKVATKIGLDVTRLGPGWIGDLNNAISRVSRSGVR